MRKRLLNILFWSVISDAFIGPGTVTTAAKAGAEYGYQLLWALLFFMVACIVLQEAAARLMLVSGLTSAVTAPLALDITAKSLFHDEKHPGWDEGQRWFTAV